MMMVTGSAAWLPYLLVIILCISTVAAYTEIKKYLRREKELRRTNDMYIVHMTIIPAPVIVWTGIAVLSAVVLLLIYLEYIEVKF